MGKAVDATAYGGTAYLLEVERMPKGSGHG